MNTRKLMVVISILTAGFCGCEMTQMTPSAPAGRSQGERAPVFSADSVIATEILRGSNYRLDERVPVEEYQYVFKIRSDFGEVTARGRDMLGLRLRELKSIETAKNLSKNPRIVEGILTPLKDSGKGLDLIFNEPFESIERAPKGLELMVDQYTDPADRRAGSTSRRKLAVELDCDPETRNPVLKKLLDELTMYELGGSLLTQGAMYFIPIPGLGVFAMTAQMKELITNSPPSVINGKIDSELGAAGVESSIRSQFRKSGAFTTVQRLQLMEQFNALEGVQNRAALIEVAAKAHTEAEALSSIRKGKMLADIRKRQPIRLLKFVGMFPLAILNNETHVLICPYDYVTSTRELDIYLSAYRASNPNVTTVLVTAGQVSPAVIKKLDSARISIVEERIFTGDEV